MNGAD
jgi:hypothetical protein